MTNEEIQNLLDKEDSEHDQLVQPREIDKQLRRLARVGLWAEKNRVVIVDALLAVHWGSDELSFLEESEQKEIRESSGKALDETTWSRE